MVARDNFEGKYCFLPWLLGSQCCEQAFRAVRSMSGTFSTMINFGMLGLLRHLHQLDIQCNLQAQTQETGIKYPVGQKHCSDHSRRDRLILPIINFCIIGMEKQRAKCWHNRSKFEQNTFSSQVELIYIITPNVSNATVGGSLTQILIVFCH